MYECFYPLKRSIKMSLKSSTKTDTNLYTLEIEISAEDFENAQVKAFNKQKNRISLPGFRKQKNGRKLLRQGLPL